MVRSGTWGLLCLKCYFRNGYFGNHRFSSSDVIIFSIVPGKQ